MARHPNLFPAWRPIDGGRDYAELIAARERGEARILLIRADTQARAGFIESPNALRARAADLVAAHGRLDEHAAADLSRLRTIMESAQVALTYAHSNPWRDRTGMVGEAEGDLEHARLSYTALLSELGVGAAVAA